MIKNPKAKGSRNERRALRVLEAQGYRVCKSGGSLGLYDVIAVGGCDVVLVQVKSNRLPPPQERKAIADHTAIPPNCRKEIWVFYDYVKIPRIIKVK